MIRATASLLFLICASSASAQPSLLADLQTARAKYPTPIITPAEQAAILNAVAWLHRSDGWGLEAKASGHTCPLPNGATIACDILRFKPNNTGRDVLGKTGSGEAIPQWGTVGPANPLTFVDPIQPSDGLPDAGGNLAAKVAALEAQLFAIDSRVATLQGDLAQTQRGAGELAQRIAQLEARPSSDDHVKALIAAAFNAIVVSCQTQRAGFGPFAHSHGCQAAVK